MDCRECLDVAVVARDLSHYPRTSKTHRSFQLALLRSFAEKDGEGPVTTIEEVTERRRM